MFLKGKLKAVWSYSPRFVSAQLAYEAFFQELMANSMRSPSNSDFADKLGYRELPQQEVLLSKPLSVEAEYVAEISFHTATGSVFFQEKRAKDGTMYVEVATVRDK